MHFGAPRGGGDIILVVRGWLAIGLLGSLLASVGPVASAQLKDREKNVLELPPNMKDEDEDVAEETTYVFNPIQAKREVKVGRFYEKKGNHRAAAGRYLEATRWNPSFAEAYWRLGRAREKMSQGQQALDAYRKYLELDPNGAKSKDVRKKVGVLEKTVTAQVAEDDAPVAAEVR